MKSVIIVGLILMAMCLVAFIGSVLAVLHEEKLEKKRRERAFMCKKTVREGLCPHCCEKWPGELKGEKL